jgi:uncharacterized repeat protein (TIGR03803 family)
MNCLSRSIFFVSVLMSKIVIAQGELWGSTASGGVNGIGTIFKTNANGTEFMMEFQLKSLSTGFSPIGDMTLASNGKIYGTTSSGGAKDGGVIFEFNTVSNSYEKRFDLTLATGTVPFAKLLQATNGKMYGASTSGGVNNNGTLFEFDPVSGSCIKLVDLNTASTGSSIYGSLVQGSNGKIYGTTIFGGANGDGVLFEFDPTTGAYTKMHDFLASSSGSQPYGGLMISSNGLIYGITYRGGIGGLGTLFSFDIKTGVISKILDMGSGTAFNLNLCRGSMVELSNGKLYGATSKYLFEFDPATGTMTNTFNLIGEGTVFILNNSHYQLLKSANGKLYGVENSRGSNSCGYLFEFDPISWSLTNKYDFTIPNRFAFSKTAIVQAANGSLYGTIYSGGSFGVGLIYEFNPTNNIFQIRHNFLGHTDGANPQGNFIRDSNGRFYGVTSGGGINGDGTIFSYNPATGTYSKIVDFNNSITGSNPLYGLVRASNNKYYGVTNRGGSGNLGVIFEFDPASSNVSTKFNFSGASGSNPSGSLVVASNGLLYGLTQAGGTNEAGVIYEFEPNTGSVQKKADFSATIGIRPLGRLIEVDNNFYGVALNGGTTNAGTIFQYNLINNSLSERYSFATLSGSFPIGGLTPITNEKVYGIASTGGQNNLGTIFQFNLATGIYTKLFDFDKLNGGFTSGTNSLTLSNNGKLYGLTFRGGENDFGVLFQYDTESNQYLKLHDFNDLNGRSPRGSLLNLKENEVITAVADVDYKLIHPNPAIESITLSFADNLKAKEIHIYQLDGRIVDTFRTTNQKLEIDVRGYLPNLYLVRIYSEGKLRSEKFVKY